jgi:hypothetical protein
VGLALPALSAARASGRTVQCLSNLRQNLVLCAAYAQENKGRGPAIGVPYASAPNWAYVVQESMGRTGTGSAVYASGAGSPLICPAAAAALGPDTQRTYGMTTTGHNRAADPGDRDNFDQAPGAFINFELVAPPAQRVLLVDTLRAPTAPPGRTAGVLDWRTNTEVSTRLARPHPGAGAGASGAGGSFAGAHFDGSARTHAQPDADWQTPLP